MNANSGLLAAVISAAVFFTGPLQAQSSPAHAPVEPSREYLIKAAFLYNLAKFTVWPESANGEGGDHLKICVLGRNPFGLALRALDGTDVKGRTVATRQVAGVDEIEGCQVVFISASERSHLSEILEQLDDAPVLSVADMPAFADNGGVIGLVTKDDKIRFEINLAAAERAGLALSAKLLRLADIK